MWHILIFTAIFPTASPYFCTQYKCLSSKYLPLRIFPITVHTPLQYSGTAFLKDLHCFKNISPVFYPNLCLLYINSTRTFSDSYRDGYQSFGPPNIILIYNYSHNEVVGSDGSSVTAVHDGCDGLKTAHKVTIALRLVALV